MIEKVLLDYLKTRTDTAVFLELPNEPLKRFVLIEKLDGEQNNYLKSSVLSFLSYAPSLYEAAKLNEEIKAVVEGSTSLSLVSAVYLESDHKYIDQVTKNYRYRAVFEIFHY